MRRGLALLGVAAVLLAGCGSDEPDTPAAPQPAISAAPSAEGEDVTAQVRAAAGNAAETVMSATRTGDRIVVETSVVDPRGGEGSPAAQTAIAVCEAALGLLDGAESPAVSVMEADGTTFVLHGHPAYPEPCTEV